MRTQKVQKWLRSKRGRIGKREREHSLANWPIAGQWLTDWMNAWMQANQQKLHQLSFLQHFFFLCSSAPKWESVVCVCVAACSSAPVLSVQLGLVDSVPGTALLQCYSLCSNCRECSGGGGGGGSRIFLRQNSLSLSLSLSLSCTNRNTLSVLPLPPPPPPPLLLLLYSGHQRQPGFSFLFLGVGGNQCRCRWSVCVCVAQLASWDEIIEAAAAAG